MLLPERSRSKSIAAQIKKLLATDKATETKTNADNKMDNIKMEIPLTYDDLFTDD